MKMDENKETIAEQNLKQSEKTEKKLKSRTKYTFEKLK